MQEQLFDSTPTLDDVRDALASRLKQKVVVCECQMRDCLQVAVQYSKSSHNELTVYIRDVDDGDDVFVVWWWCNRHKEGESRWLPLDIELLIEYLQQKEILP